MRELQGSPTAVVATPAAREFASLEAWLAARRTLQLPLHQIESQQQTKAARYNACCCRLISNSAVTEMWDLRFVSHKPWARCCTPIVDSALVA
jgi:hypothetical protein